MVAAPGERELARQIARLQRGLRQVQRGSQAAHRSPVLSDGPVEFVDDQGVTRLVIGENEDGTVTATPVNSTPPPPPTSPTLVPVEGGVEVIWDGTFVEANRPADLSLVEVHVSENADFVAEDVTQVHSFTSEFGGNYFISAGPDAPLYFALVAVNQEGLESDKSEEVSATALPFPTPEIPPDPAPTASPAIMAVKGTPNSLVVVTEPIRPGDKLKYYISNDPDFVPGPATQVGPDTRATVNVILTDADEQPLALDTTYYVAVLAFNDQGAAPAPSDTASGELDLSAVSELIAATVYAGFVLTGRLQVGQITIDANDGIVIPTAAGDITFPIDGTEAYIRAAVTTTSLTAQGITNLQQAINLAGQMVVAAGVDNPTIKPTVVWFRPTEVPTGPNASVWNPSSQAMRGLSYNGTEWVTAYQTSGSPAGITVNFMDRTTYDVEQISLPIPAGHTLDTLYGSTFVNNRYCFLVTSSVAGAFATRVWTYSLAGGVFTLESNFVVLNDFTIVVARAAIGPDGNDILVMKPGPFGSGAWKYESWTVAGVANGGGNLAIPSGDQDAYESAALGGCYRGNADYGSARIVVGCLERDTVTFAFDGANWNWQNGERWARPQAYSVGPWWDSVDGRFWHAGGDNKLYPNSKVRTDFTVEGRYSWRDENVVGGTHETMPSPASTSIVWIKRLWLKFTASPAPGVGGVGDDKADRVAFYLRRTSGVAGSQRRIHVGAVGESEILTENWEPPDTDTGTTTSATNTFDGIVGLEGWLASGKQVSALPVWKLFGSGEGNVGPWKWDNAGVQVPAMVPNFTTAAITNYAGGNAVRSLGSINIAALNGWSTLHLQLWITASSATHLNHCVIVADGAGSRLVGDLTQFRKTAGQHAAPQHIDYMIPVLPGPAESVALSFFTGNTLASLRCLAWLQE